MNLDLEPAGPVELIAEEGYRGPGCNSDCGRARRWRSSSRTTPTPSSVIPRHVGPGPYATRIAVHDLAANATISRREARLHRMAASSAANGRRVVIDPGAIEGFVFEFVEYEPLS